MKKGILLLFVVLMGFTSCGKKFGHRYLDGMWQMQRIEYKDGNIDTPLDTYFSFQMDIIHLRKLGNSEFYGNMSTRTTPCTYKYSTLRRNR